jgi:hypothetical protein
MTEPHLLDSSLIIAVRQGLANLPAAAGRQVPNWGGFAAALADGYNVCELRLGTHMTALPYASLPVRIGES